MDPHVRDTGYSPCKAQEILPGAAVLVCYQEALIGCAALDQEGGGSHRCQSFHGTYSHKRRLPQRFASGKKKGGIFICLLDLQAHPGKQARGRARMKLGLP